MALQFVCDLSITNPHSQLSQLLRNPSLIQKLPDVWLLQLLAFLGAEVWDNRDGNKQAGNVRATREGSTEITCLSPKAVKAVDLCSLHLLFIFFWKIEQVGDDLKQNYASDHELKCVIQELLTSVCYTRAAWNTQKEGNSLCLKPRDQRNILPEINHWTCYPCIRRKTQPSVLIWWHRMRLGKVSSL